MFVLKCIPSACSGMRQVSYLRCCRLSALRYSITTSILMEVCYQDNAILLCLSTTKYRYRCCCSCVNVICLTNSALHKSMFVGVSAGKFQGLVTELCLDGKLWWLGNNGEGGCRLLFWKGGVLPGCIQRFPDWVDNVINNNNKHSLRSNKKSYGVKIQ